MKTNAILLFALMVLGLSSCSTTDSSTNPTPVSSDTPYFEYQINAATAVRVDCSNILFEASTGGTSVRSVYGESASTKAIFSFAFYGGVAAMDTVKTGNRPLMAYSNFTIKEPFHISFKVPQTTGGTDYYYGLAPSESSHKHTLKSITKAGMENGKQVYWVEGEFKGLGQQLSSTTTATITGKYRFKLLTIL